MPDNKDTRGNQDRNRVSAKEEWEMDYLIEQTGASRQEIMEAIKVVGNNRDKVEQYLRDRRVF